MAAKLAAIRLTAPANEAYRRSASSILKAINGGNIMKMSAAWRIENLW